MLSQQSSALLSPAGAHGMPAQATAIGQKEEQLQTYLVSYRNFTSL